MIRVTRARAVDATMYGVAILYSLKKIIPMNIRSDVAMNNSTGSSKKSLVLFS